VSRRTSTVLLGGREGGGQASNRKKVRGRGEEIKSVKGMEAVGNIRWEAEEARQCGRRKKKTGLEAEKED